MVTFLVDFAIIGAEIWTFAHMCALTWGSVGNAISGWRAWLGSVDNLKQLYVPFLIYVGGITVVTFLAFGIDRTDDKPGFYEDRSREYWTGYALAYYQWWSGLGFDEINAFMPVTRIRDLYHPYHEMDIRQFVDHMNELMRLRTYISNLKRIRMDAGLSQSQLARESGVPLRTIQQYEQRQKNINKAQAEYLLMLASSLSCNPEDLLEKI